MYYELYIIYIMWLLYIMNDILYDEYIFIFYFLRGRGVKYVLCDFKW